LDKIIFNVARQSATIVMQPQTRITTYLFSAWLLHFIGSTRCLGSVPSDHRHLLVMGSHSSHVSLEVLHEARRVRLDLITLPSHTSHPLQPLDVSDFKPFKQFFCQYKDYWTSCHFNESASKETLAHWVSLSLRRVMSHENITKGFMAINIFLLKTDAI
jgi:hypothetical protein